MKKLILVLTAIALLAMGAALPAWAAPAMALDEPVVTGSQITMSGTLTDGYMSEIAYYVVELENDVEQDNYAAVGQQAVTLADGAFSIMFTMSSAAESGTYRIAAASVKSEARATAEFEFISEGERTALISELTQDTITVDEIQAIFEDAEKIPVLTAMGCITADFAQMSDALKDEVAELVQSDLNGYFEKPYSETDFMTLYNYAVAYVATVRDTSADVAEMLTKYSDIFGIDTEGLENSPFLTEKIRDTEADSTQSVAAVYNEAVAVMAFSNEIDYKNVPALIEKYKDVLGLDLTDYQALTSSQKTQVHQAMLEVDYNTGAEVKTQFDKAVNGAVYVPPGNGGGGGSSGGNSSSGSNAPYVPIIDQDNKEQDAETVPVFEDLAGYEWAQEAIETLAEQHFISGVGDNTFEPARQITREEFVKILTSAFALVDSSAACSFEDVSPDAWYYTYVASAVESGIVSGKSPTVFGTGAYITREEIAALLVRVADRQSILLSEGEEKEFTDSDEIAGYAQDAVSRLASAGIINGRDDGRFAPQETATRAEAARLIYGLWELVYGQN